MHENNLYLKFLINEDIYIVHENEDSSLTDDRPAITVRPFQLKTLTDKTIVVIDYPENIIIPGTLKTFLSKILQAVGLKIEDIYLFDIGKSDTENMKLEDYNLSDCRIIGFTKRIPKRFKTTNNITKYKISKVEGNKVILADTLEEIEKNKSKKLLLWEKLKDLYQIK